MLAITASQSLVFSAAGEDPHHHGHSGLSQRMPGPGQLSCGHARSGCASQIQPLAQRQATRTESITLLRRLGDQLSIVNASGFPFQLQIVELVRSTHERHQWDVTSQEHSWRDGETPRFIDIVLTQGRVHLVIECKRQRGGEWIFLVPDPPLGRRAELRRWFRASYLRNADSSAGRSAVTNLANFQLDPKSWESSFCAVPGATDRAKDTPTLDRICAELTRSTDAIIAAAPDFACYASPHGKAPIPRKHASATRAATETRCSVPRCTALPDQRPRHARDVPAR